MFIFLQPFGPDDGGTMIVTMWGITVIDTALYPTVTMMTTVPAATAAATRTRTTKQHIVLMFLKDTKKGFSIILFIKKRLSQDDRNKNRDIIERTVCMFCTYFQPVQ